MIFEDRKIEGLVTQCRFAEACATLTVTHAQRRLRAGVYALAGDEQGVARWADPELLICRTGAEVAAYYAVSGVEPSAYDSLVAATVLAWSADAAAAYDAFGAAHDRAISERQVHLAVAARERLAHHALLFGNVELARNAIAEGLALARAHRLSRWSLRCLAAAARLALDAGDLDRTADLLTRAKLTSALVEDCALFAATGAQLAVELGDAAALREWSAPGILDVALRCELPEAAISATMAVVIAAGMPAPGALSAMALRRALFQADRSANAPELFSMAARYGDLDDARFGVESLAGFIAPNRCYLKAHRFLARAHFLARSGDRAGWTDCAGDAARAFSAMNLRRWTNEAMRLLVAQQPSREGRTRGRATGSALTGREEQVANLIRRGAGNREVAIALQISVHTVERHVSSILGRLGLRSRWQIADPQNGDDR